MGLISGKVAAAGLAGALLTGVVFTGGPTIDKTKDLLDDLRDKVVQFNANETTLKQELQNLHTDSNNRIAKANEIIADKQNEINSLKANKQYLESVVKYLEQRVDDLVIEVKELKDELGEANDTIEAKEAEIVKLTEELETTQDQLTETEADLEKLEKEYAELEAENNDNKDEVQRANDEVQKANEKVEELADKAAEVEEATEGKDPMTDGEIEEINTSLDEVNEGQYTVENLNLTYIQLTEEFIAEHPELDIQEGERVWRITNNNDFDVAVTYSFAGSSDSETVLAGTGQTFFKTDKGGTLTISWENEKGDIKNNTKAGA
ncbi:hypothetical protein [Salipaludibacillus aurantiacus]|uniref:Uncharacterized protein n=1 Tax=Salipaludibacillus aurantiacus TaxID=1601833 RepID=A0A1H9VVX1_9BACI|nr:hypothetical protein [Salipaludibacillus aurantiacus]SES25896.1 hypothetical protein SAMN05518684_1134 [Salipaludibacillus aurantiacus]